MKEKFYVLPGSVYITPDAIYVDIDGNFVRTNSIKTDERGIYVEKLETACMVYCARCNLTYDREKYSARCPHNTPKYR